MRKLQGSCQAQAAKVWGLGPGPDWRDSKGSGFRVQGLGFRGSGFRV